MKKKTMTCHDSTLTNIDEQAFEEGLQVFLKDPSGTSSTGGSLIVLLLCFIFLPICHHVCHRRIRRVGRLMHAACTCDLSSLWCSFFSSSNCCAAAAWLPASCCSSLLTSCSADATLAAISARTTCTENHSCECQYACLCGKHVSL